MTEPLMIGPVRLPNRIFMAPLSGVSDLPMRKRALAAGAGMVVSEMIASGELASGTVESIRRMAPVDGAIHVVQLAGREETAMRHGARLAADAGADIIDINMGCPAKKVTGGYCGAALMRDLDHALRLIEATVGAVSVPVTLKMRLGWDRSSINAPDLARGAVDAGVQAITVHGRTRDQFYEGSADWHAVRAVREAVAVPLTVNGDIETGDQLSAAVAASGADAVMIGRGHYGRPWLAGQLIATLGGKSNPQPADLAEYIIDHYDDMLSHYGIVRGIRHARKHLGWYIGRLGTPVDPEIVTRMMRSSEPSEVKALINAVLVAAADETRFAA
jgi:nifR3 family TIM-barrel protein